MSDEQLRKKRILRKIIIGCILSLLVSASLLYYVYKTNAPLQQYLSEKAQELSLQSQIDTLNKTNQELLATIEENGKQLVSFSEDKIRYVNLASELSMENNVRINKFTVSDVWQEGEMSAMTVAIEVQGTGTDVTSFVSDFCDTEYTNRINIVSMRPMGKYAWLTRDIDGSKVIGWFDTTEDQELYEQQMDILETEEKLALQQQGIYVEDTFDPLKIVPVYNPETGKIVDVNTGVELTSEQLEQIPMTLDTLFAEKLVKMYIVVDFLGRN